MTITKRQLRDVALAATFLGFVLSGCRDEPLAIPSKPKPPEAAAGEAAAGETSGGDGGTSPTTGGSAGNSNAGTPSVGGNAGTPAVGGTGGTAGTGGGIAGAGGKPPLLNCGDGKPDEGEECDDGNKVSGDGCSAQCQSSCETCEKNVCVEYDSNFENRYENCYRMPGLAQGGPAKGIAREELCRAVVDCVRESGCAKRSGEYGYDIDHCYCEYNLTRDECNEPDFVHGPCYREFQEASEQDLVGLKVLTLTNTLGIPLGAGGLLLGVCDKYVCRDECVPEQVPEGEVTTISASIGAVRNDAGESSLGDLVADAFRAAGMTDFALVRPVAMEGNYDLAFEATPNRAADADGRVLLTELVSVILGYENNGRPEAGQILRTLKLTGQQLYDAMNLESDRFHVSGLTYTWDESQPLGKKIVELRKGGVAINKATVFTLTVDSKVTNNVIASATDVVDLTVSPPTALVNYVKSLPKPVAPPKIERIQRLN